MGFIKFIFVLVILVPIAIVMFFLIGKLLDEVSGNTNKSKRNKSSHNSSSEYDEGNDYLPEYMRGNAQYDAYRQNRSKYIKNSEAYRQGENSAAGNTVKINTVSDSFNKRKKRKERKLKKNSKV